MSKVIFIYEGKKIEIPCQKEDKMKTICTKFANKVGEKINHLFFLSDGKKLDLNKSLKQIKSFSFFDIKILANKLEEENEKLFICPNCGEDIDSYNNSFYDILSINDSIIDKLNELKRKLEEIIGTNNMQANIIFNELKTIESEVEKKKEEIREQLRKIYINNSKKNIIDIKLDKGNSYFLLYNSFQEIEVKSDLEIIQPIECKDKKKYFNSEYDNFKLYFISRCINLSEFFRDCSSLTYIDLSNFDSSDVTDMSYMFSDCSSLKEINLSNKFNTSKVINMESMFRGCTNLNSLDLSNFDTSNVTNMNKMFYYCPSLYNIIGINDLNTKNVINENNIFSFIKKDWINIYKHAIIIVEEEKVIYNNFIYNKNYNIYFLKDNIYYPFIPSINKIELQNEQNIKKQFLLISIDDKIKLSNLDFLTYIDLSNFDSSDVTDMSYMFSNCSSLKEINLSNKFNTSKVINMESMFRGCKNLNSLDLSNFDTSNVTNMSHMFYDCSSLKEIKLTNKFNTSQVTNMKYMFSGCTNLSSLDLSNFDTSNVTNMSHMFGEYSSLITNKPSRPKGRFLGYLPNLPHRQNMDCGCKNLISLDLSNFDTSNVTNMSFMLCGCSSLKEINLSNKFNTNKVINMESMIIGCKNLNSLDLSNFDVSKVTNMNKMFEFCPSLGDVIGINELNLKFCLKILGN